MDMFSIENLNNLWNQFFWAEENVSTWIIFKWFFGTVMLANTALLFKDRFLFYDCHVGLGIRNKRDPHTVPPWARFCLWDYLPDTKASTTLIFSAWIASLFAFLLGAGGWMPILIIVACETSRIHRNIMCNHAGDTYARLIWWCMLAAYALNPMANVGGLSYYQEYGNMGIDATWNPWPLRMIMILWISCYTNAAIHKLKGAMWRNGTASFYPLYCNGFRRWPVPLFLLSPIFVKIGTWGAIVMEASAPLALVPSLRPYIVGGIAAMHMVFEYCLNLQLFGVIMLAGCIAWISPDFAHSVLELII